MKESERRQRRRVRAKFIVTCKLDKSKEFIMWVGNRKVEALMLDLSELGMAVLAEHNIPKNTVLEISFTLMNYYANQGQQHRAMTMEISGVVQNNTAAGMREYRLGIGFQGLSKEKKEAIANFVKLTQ